jgi:hypothetical protein
MKKMAGGELHIVDGFKLLGVGGTAIYGVWCTVELVGWAWPVVR